MLHFIVLVRLVNFIFCLQHIFSKSVQSDPDCTQKRALIRVAQANFDGAPNEGKGVENDGDAGATEGSFLVIGAGKDQDNSRDGQG